MTRRKENFKKFLIIVILGTYAVTGYEFHELRHEAYPTTVISTISMVRAAEEVVEVEVEKKEPTIEEMIAKAFPEDPQQAIEIAKCESGLDPSRVGDHHLTVVVDGETLGTSHGLFQVRTGGQESNGKVWNRAKANGMTADEFIAWMHDPQANIDYARDIYDRRGYEAWHNCAIKTLAYKK